MSLELHPHIYSQSLSCADPLTCLVLVVVLVLILILINKKIVRVGLIHTVIAIRQMAGTDLYVYDKTHLSP
jgi:hypothetical protein